VQPARAVRWSSSWSKSSRRGPVVLSRSGGAHAIELPSLRGGGGSGCRNDGGMEGKGGKGGRRSGGKGPRSGGGKGGGRGDGLRRVAEPSDGGVAGVERSGTVEGSCMASPCAASRFPGDKTLLLSSPGTSGVANYIHSDSKHRSARGGAQRSSIRGASLGRSRDNFETVWRVRPDAAVVGSTVYTDAVSGAFRS
jgi:hypothetical protein